MSDTEKKNGGISTAEESVDDILAGILNADGTFNDEFNGLFAKYFVGTQQEIKVPDVDISDRSDEINPKSRVTYDSGEVSYSREMTADERIEEKIPESVRAAFAEASSEAQRPEFTSTGNVKYPTMGVGASEQRVVFDADWEETAKKEAARLERVRQDRLLRGDSTYARTFVAGGMYMPQKSPYVNAPGANSLYIDPLSKDDDFESADSNSQYYSSQKKSFFPEGFSVIQKNNVAAGGKTEKRMGSNNSHRTAYRNSSMSSYSDKSWLQVEEKAEKKKRFGKKKKQTEAVSALFEENSEKNDMTVQDEVTENIKADTSYSAPLYAPEELEAVEDETKGLRSTVAEIVDKYNKRNEEEQKRKFEEQVRMEELRREEELRERRRQEELRLIKKELSPELVNAIDSEEEEDFFMDSEDFSTEPADKEAKAEEKKDSRTFGVVFDPDAFSDNNYVEKLSEQVVFDDETEKDEQLPDDKNIKSKKKPVISLRRKEN